MNISRKYFENQIREVVDELLRDSRFEDTREFIQHGDTSVYVHCICVAYMSCIIIRLLHIRVDLKSLIIGALLHDYFLYDWHDGKLCRKIHGFTHPFTAARNAKRDMNIDSKVENIIKCHMFPLVPIPPSCREAWIVCLADKIVATEETAKGHCSGRKAAFARKLLNEKCAPL